MRFEWDDAKDRSNFTKHKLSFETARLVFDDPLAVSVPDRVVAGEERWQTLGRVDGMIIFLVAHTYRSQGEDEVVQIVSARKATPRERRFYEQAQHTTNE
jgi:uncharacterized DUF497 family protein